MRIFLTALLGVVAIAAAIGFAVKACSVRTQSATHIAAWSMPPSEYSVLIESLDGALSPFGLTRRSGNPSLDKFQEREVLVTAYLDEKVSVIVLDLNDLKGAGQVEIRAYAESFRDPETREKFISSVRSCIDRFGGSLVPK